LEKVKGGGGREKVNFFVDRREEDGGGGKESEYKEGDMGMGIFSWVYGYDDMVYLFIV